MIDFHGKAMHGFTSLKCYQMGKWFRTCKKLHLGERLSLSRYSRKEVSKSYPIIAAIYSQFMRERFLKGQTCIPNTQFGFTDALN
jgi:hypothetical protein